MVATYWFKQQLSEPLYAELLWSRPENKRQAGKLLIIGGNEHGFAAPAEAFRVAESAGIGTARMALPDSLRRFVGQPFAAGELLPTTPSGSFSQNALAEMLAAADWADGVLIAGDVGRNSETAILLEKFAVKYVKQLTVTQDAADYFTASPTSILERPNTLLVISMAQLQKLAMKSKFTTAITFGMSLVQLAEALHEFTEAFRLNIIVKHLDRILVSSDGKVSSTFLENDREVWRVATATQASVWWLQNPPKTFEAITAAIYSQYTSK